MKLERRLKLAEVSYKANVKVEMSMKKLRTIVIIYSLLLASFGSNAKNYQVEEGEYL